MTVTAYPTPGKEKARIICEAFASGCGGRVARQIPDKLLPGAAMFYGVTPATVHLLEQAKREGRDWFYADNSYLDPCRETYFRVTRNALQHSGMGGSDGSRFASLGIRIHAWQQPKPNGHILICPQSDEFLALLCGQAKGWSQRIAVSIEQMFNAGSPYRSIIVRHWQHDKAAAYRTLPAALVNCHVVVTWSSASAITAILRGIPAIVLAEDCIARPVARHSLAELENPLRIEGDGLRHWANILADQQWTLDEMRSGLCWKMLSAGLARAA